MGRININFASHGLVPPGDHPVEIERVTLREKIDGSNEYLFLDMRVVSGDHAGARLDTVGSRHPDRLRMTAQMLAALGVDPVGNAEFEIETVDDDLGETIVVSPDLVGCRAVAHVTHREFGGQTYPRVRSLTAA